MKKPGPSSFEATYPAITRWVKEFGRIEIGQDDYMDNFVKAIDRGGMPWGGKSEYKSIDEALLDMEKGIKAFLEDQSLDKRASPKRRPSKQSAKQAGKPPSRAGKETLSRSSWETTARLCFCGSWLSRASDRWLN